MKKLIMCFCVLSLFSVAIAEQVIYHEVSTFIDTTHVQTSNAGWRWFNWDGTTWRNETNSTQTQISSANGAPVEIGSINSNPAVADATSGFLYCSQTYYGTGKNLLLYTDEFMIDPNQWENLVLSFRNNNSAVETFGGVVAIADTNMAPGWTWDQVSWYVTALQSVPKNSWSTDTTSFELATASWSHLNVNAITHVLAVGDSVGSLPAGDIVGFGFFGQDRVGVCRLDNFMVSGTWQGEKNMLTVAVSPSDAGIVNVIPTVGDHACKSDDTIPLYAFDQLTPCPVMNFDHWVIDGSIVTTPLASVTMDNAKTVTAYYVLAPSSCGDSCHPYPSMDFNQDCFVDMTDFASFAAEWMKCTDPSCD